MPSRVADGRELLSIDIYENGYSLQRWESPAPLPDYVSLLFLTPPSLQELEKRMAGRNICLMLLRR